MFITVPVTRDIYAAHFGNGMRETVTPDKFPRRTGNGIGNWSDGIDWNSMIQAGTRAGTTIATARWGQPNINRGTAVQRHRNADGSYSEVLSRQESGYPVGLNTAAAAGIGISAGTLMVVGVGVVAFVMMQRGRR